MAPRSRYKSVLPKIKQNSAFLRLPGEIRTHIYRAALVKPDAIDLWPFAFVDNPEDVPEIVKRIKASTEGKLTSLNDRGVQRCFHYQHDLEFVRKQLAIGLLGTCHQVRMEATSIFWQENSFRFSVDFQWIGIRRFFTSIGPEARSRIKTVEISPPAFAAPMLRIVGDGGKHNLLYGAKQHPKLHMAKLFNNKAKRRGAASLSDENFRFVSELVHRERTLHVLRIVVSEGWMIGQSHSTGLFGVKFTPEQLGPLRFLDMKLVLEKGAQLAGGHEVALISRQGIKIIAMPGSAVSPQFSLANILPPQLAPEEIKEKMEWGPFDDGIEDYLLCLENIFNQGEKSDDAILKRGNKKTLKKKSTARVLKGFGGCRFVHRQGRFCLDCGQRIEGYWSYEYMKRFQETGSYCMKCNGKTGYIHKDDIEVRKLARENRKNAQS